jgi:hypothetical protein
MSRTIASKFMNFLPIAGMSILFFSLFMKWFSCGHLGNSFSLELSYIDWLKRGNVNFYYLYFLCLSFATCFLFASYFSGRVSINKYFVLFLFMLFPTVLFSMLGALLLATVGFHMTVDYPCYTEPGLWLYIFGFALILIGGCFRARRNA